MYARWRPYPRLIRLPGTTCTIAFDHVVPKQIVALHLYRLMGAKARLLMEHMLPYLSGTWQPDIISFLMPNLCLTGSLSHCFAIPCHSFHSPIFVPVSLPPPLQSLWMLTAVPFAAADDALGGYQLSTFLEEPSTGALSIISSTIRGIDLYFDRQV